MRMDSTTTPKKKPKRTLLNLKVTDAQRKVMTANAKRFADGNISEWLRVAGVKYKASKKDF